MRAPLILLEVVVTCSGAYFEDTFRHLLVFSVHSKRF